jgi:pimeloyl-ACP methyl ester carboxylesterase
MDDDEVDQYFQSRNIKVDLKSIQVNDRTIFYAATGSDTARMIIFIHGTPGAWTNFINFLGDQDLSAKYRVISIERPGFGHSDFGYPEASLEKQALLMKPVLEQNQSDKLPIVIGHSIGGPIVAKMMMMYPELIGSIVLVAPSIDPSLEPKEPWRKLIRLPIINSLVPIAVQVSNEEIYFLKQQLTEMLPEWKEIKKPVVVIQGGDDFLVDPGNARFAEEALTNTEAEIMFIEDADHFIPWTSPDLIIEALERLN